MIPTRMKYDTQSLSEKVNSDGEERVVQVADQGFKFCQKMPFFGSFGHAMFVEGAICIGTDLDDEQGIKNAFYCTLGCSSKCF